ncbi:unnamed protein product [Mytilus coruscus]|uniref:Uncharacterized protein n=1 Tax=Mytilus coruscus TaxID=42192 RepID=A0A6J8B6T7_MYTCO|nr:unnamed protein product [Mytilus coruscus]
MLKNNTSTDQILKNHGYFPLSVSDVFTCLRKNLHYNSIQVMYGLFDWSLIWKVLSSMKNDLVRLRFQKMNLRDNIPTESIDSASSNDELLDVLQSSVIEPIQKITNIVLRIATCSRCCNDEKRDVNRRIGHRFHAVHVIEKTSHTRFKPSSIQFCKHDHKKKIVIAVADLMNKENVKLFDILTSLYQLLLSLELQTDLITLFATVDMRVHFPELLETVCRFTNPVLLFAKINRDKSFLSFLKSNKMSILGAIESSLLPHDTIMKLLNNLSPADVIRHQLVMTNVRDMRDFQDHESMNEVKIKRISAGAYYNETTLYVWNDMENNHLEIELAHSTLVVENSHARHILSILL